MSRRLLLPLLLLLAAPATAGAAYAPKLTVDVAPTPNATSKLTTVLTQAGGETANKTVVVSLPAGFVAPGSLDTLPVCSAEQEAARACPPETTIGSAAATASVVGLPVGLAGKVHWGGLVDGSRFKIIVFLDNDMLDQHLTQQGFITIRPDAGFDTTFDNLPDQLTTSFTLTFDGGAKAIIQTPSDCGEFVFRARFTSQAGEQAASEAPTTISGCPPPPVKLDRLRLATNRRSLSFRLNRDAATRVKVTGPGLKLNRLVQAKTGITTVKFTPKRKGTYTVKVAAGKDSRETTFRLKRDR